MCSRASKMPKELSLEADDTCFHYRRPSASWAHGTGTLARRMQDIESDTGYDTRRRTSDGALARLSQTSVYDTC